ncbi:EamA family transporter [Flavobacterium sp. fv08]|uniref:EamA family transporter n=1 Tax=Flavobacterium sp. fv08 TaxID=1761784 RepID=UPI003519A29D
MGLGVLLPVYLYFFPVENLIPNLKDTFYLILLSFFYTIDLYVSFVEILKKIPAFTVNLSFNLEPIYAIILAYVFNESKEVNASFYIRLFFYIMLSVVLQSIISLRKNKLFCNFALLL